MPLSPPVPCHQRVAWAKLSKFEHRFLQFLDILRRVYVDVPLIEALKKTPTYLKFLRELLSKKSDSANIAIVLIREAYSVILQSKSPVMLQR